MTLEDQVTSLKISKRLKELGVKQESLYKWFPFPQFGKESEWSIGNTPDNGYRIDSYSAFTVAELGEKLPKRLIGKHPLWYLTIHCNDDYYNVSYETFSGIIEKDFEARDRNEANARGLMLIYLLENKLTTL